MNTPCTRALASRQRQRGFTLVEAIISAGLIGLLAVTATYFWVDSLGLVRTVNADSAAIADGRALLERLAREIREVKYDTASGTYCVVGTLPDTTTQLATQMVFNKTSGTYATGCGGANPTAATNDIAVTIQRGSTLYLGYTASPAASAASSPLTAYATSFGIRYRDAGYAVTTSKSLLRFVELTLTLQPASVQATQVRTVVALRNN
jgi:type II secretory pathway pseudopilin PulG